MASTTFFSPTLKVYGLSLCGLVSNSLPFSSFDRNIMEASWDFFGKSPSPLVIIYFVTSPSSVMFSIGSVDVMFLRKISFALSIRNLERYNLNFKEQKLTRILYYKIHLKERDKDLI